MTAGCLRSWLKLVIRESDAAKLFNDSVDIQSGILLQRNISGTEGWLVNTVKVAAPAESNQAPTDREACIEMHPGEAQTSSTKWEKKGKKQNKKNSNSLSDCSCWFICFLFSFYQTTKGPFAFWTGAISSSASSILEREHIFSFFYYFAWKNDKGKSWRDCGWH